MLQEVEKAKQMIEELEDQLKVERSRLRTLTTEQNQAEQQREAVVLQLRRTETVRTSCLKCKLSLTSQFCRI